MYTTSDRRVKPRINCDYPAIIEGIDANGTKYTDHAKLANLSASGLYMLVNNKVDNGTKLSVTIFLSYSSSDDEVPKLSTNGTVVRTEPQINGMYGVAVKFYKYRFM
jgi:hypothetical protein